MTEMCNRSAANLWLIGFQPTVRQRVDAMHISHKSDETLLLNNNRFDDIKI